jgi:hypothetical protein
VGRADRAAVDIGVDALTSMCGDVQPVVTAATMTDAGAMIW